MQNAECGMKRQKAVFNSAVCIPHSAFDDATPPGFEPGQREPKSLVLPLHYGVVAGRLSLLIGSRAKATPCAARTGGRTPGWAASGRVTVRGSALPPRPVPGKPLRHQHLLPIAPARSGSSTRSATRQTSRRTPLARGSVRILRGSRGLSSSPPDGFRGRSVAPDSY